MPFWQFFSQGWDGRALLVRPLRIPRWISKILFVLGSYEFLAMLQGKAIPALSEKNQESLPIFQKNIFV